MGGDVLRAFTVERVLSTDERTKCVTVLGRYVLSCSWSREQVLGILESPIKFVHMQLSNARGESSGHAQTKAF